jgi:hypothetical protein
MQDIVEEDLKAFRTNMKSVSGHKDFQPFWWAILIASIAPMSSTNREGWIP